MMNEDLKTYRKQAAGLEDKLSQFRIKAPHKPPKQVKFTSDIDAITDEMVFRFTLDDIQTELYNLKRSLVSSTTSEQLRKMFIDYTNEHLDIFNKFYKYGKLKGWTEIAPAFKTKPVHKEPLSVSEANHIWDHMICFRTNITTLITFLSMEKSKDGYT